MSYFILSAFYIMCVKLYYWYHWGDPEPHMMISVCFVDRRREYIFLSKCGLRNSRRESWDVLLLNGKLCLPLEFSSFTGGLCGIGLLQRTFRCVRLYSFQGLVLSVYWESIKRNYAIRFNPTQGLELSILSPYWQPQKDYCI